MIFVDVLQFAVAMFDIILGTVIELGRGGLVCHNGLDQTVRPNQTRCWHTALEQHGPHPHACRHLAKVPSGGTLMCDIMNCPEPLASTRFVLEYILPVLELHVTTWLDKSHRMNNIGMLTTTWICRVMARKKNIGTGILMALMSAGAERLRNGRYADDLPLYAKSLPELVYMIQILCEELAQVGLHLNGSKTKLLTTCADCVPEFVTINGETLDVLAPDAAHKYLGRKYTGDLSKRGHIGFQQRVQLAWAKFNHFRHVFTKQTHLHQAALAVCLIQSSPLRFFSASSLCH